MAKRKSRTTRHAAIEQPADYALRPDAYRHVEAMTGEGNARTTVHKRVDHLETLERRGLLTPAACEALARYRDAWQAANWDGTGSCLGSLVARSGGGGDGMRVHYARTAFNALYGALPPGCERAVTAVVIDGVHWEDVAWAMVERPMTTAARYVLGVRRYRTVRPERIKRVLAELQAAGDCLAVAVRIAA